MIYRIKLIRLYILLSITGSIVSWISNSVIFVYMMPILVLSSLMLLLRCYNCNLSPFVFKFGYFRVGMPIFAKNCPNCGANFREIDKDLVS